MSHQFRLTIFSKKYNMHKDFVSAIAKQFIVIGFMSDISLSQAYIKNTLLKNNRTCHFNILAKSEIIDAK